PVLHRVSLRVARGEVVAVLGANGSGKSTLIRAVLGLVRPSAGSVRLFGVPAPASRQRHRIGYVPQRVGAGSGVPATVGEVVRSGRLAGRGPLALWRPAHRAAGARAIATGGLAGKGAGPGAALSGGPRPRRSAPGGGPVAARWRCGAPPTGPRCRGPSPPWAWPARPPSRAPPSPAGSSSGYPSPGRSAPSRNCWSWTSPPPGWTPPAS